MDDVGVFRATIEVQNLDMRGSRKALPETLVDTGSEFTWDSTPGARGAGHPCAAQTSFRVADGRRIERDIGCALVRAAGTEAPDLVVFAEPGEPSACLPERSEGSAFRVNLFQPMKLLS
ncbi:MAG TPA: hypothetical protein VEZ49_00040 [Gemmatimonadales bacterium]|nr:hypothetical protein [Gemmatimonadales bacterium]